jgi:hypothetical protein
VYRSFKPGTASNYVTPDRALANGPSSNSSTDDNSNRHGRNQNSVPTTSAQTTSDPAQTTVTDFQSGGSEAFDTGFGNWYYTATEQTNDTGAAWKQTFNAGFQDAYSNFKTDTSIVRAVRRVLA